MIALKPITLRQYVELENKSEYDFAMKYAFRFRDPIDEYQIGDVMELPFGWVKDFQYELEQGLKQEKLIELFLQVAKIDKEKIGNEPLDKFMRACNYLIESVKQIIETENTALAHEQTQEEENAGMIRFEGLGVYLQIRSIAQTFHITPQQVREWKYSEAFAELYTAKQIADYQAELIRLRRPIEN